MGTFKISDKTNIEAASVTSSHELLLDIGTDYRAITIGEISDAISTELGGLVNTDDLDQGLAGIASDFTAGEFASLRVNPGDSGVTIPSANELGVESDGNVIVTLASPDANTIAIEFSSPSKSNFAKIIAQYNSGNYTLSMQIDATAKFYVAESLTTTTNPLRLPQYTIDGSPAPPTASNCDRSLIYVTNGAAGQPIIAFSDGSNWLRVDTRAAISKT